MRSARWFAPDDLRSFGHRSRAMQMGYGPEDWAGKPVVGIINTWSDINPCHSHFKQRVEDVKRGVLQAGGFPIELPAQSLAEQVRSAVRVSPRVVFEPAEAISDPRQTKVQRFLDRR